MSTWQIDTAHTVVSFTGKHMTITKVRGIFKGVTGTIEYDEADPTRSAVEVTIPAATVETGVEPRDNHLRSADFLDVENYSTLTFTSTGVRYSGGEDFVMVGDLTIRGTTVPVELAVELEGVATDPFGNERIGFSGETTLSRKEFGLTWNAALEAGGVLVSDKVKITLDVSAIKQP